MLNVLKFIRIRRFNHPVMGWKVELLSHPFLLLLCIADIVDAIIGLASLGFLNGTFAYELSWWLSKKRSEWVRKYLKETK